MFSIRYVHSVIITRVSMFTVMTVSQWFVVIRDKTMWKFFNLSLIDVLIIIYNNNEKLWCTTDNSKNLFIWKVSKKRNCSMNNLFIVIIILKNVKRDINIHTCVTFVYE